MNLMTWQSCFPAKRNSFRNACFVFISMRRQLSLRLTTAFLRALFCYLPPIFTLVPYLTVFVLPIWRPSTFYLQLWFELSLLPETPKRLSKSRKTLVNQFNPANFFPVSLRTSSLSYFRDSCTTLISLWSYILFQKYLNLIVQKIFVFALFCTPLKNCRTAKW